MDTVRIKPKHVLGSRKRRKILRKGLTQSKKMVEEGGHCQARVRVSNDGPKGATLIQSTRTKTPKRISKIHEDTMR